MKRMMSPRAPEHPLADGVALAALHLVVDNLDAGGQGSGGFADGFQRVVRAGFRHNETSQPPSGKPSPWQHSAILGRLPGQRRSLFVGRDDNGESDRMGSGHRPRGFAGD